MADVTFVNNSDAILELLEQAKRRGLEACGLEAESYAKINETAIDTGRLRNSITHATDENNAYIGTNVEYARYIEEGTRKYPNGLHYLKRSVSEHTERYRQLLIESFRNA